MVYLRHGDKFRCLQLFSHRNCNFICDFSLALTYIGYFKFKKVDKIVQKRLDKEMNKFTETLQKEIYDIQNANSKIQKSYDLFDVDIDKAIGLLAEAENAYPKAYNLYNTLGYAYLKKNDNITAKMMFKRAIELHPHNIQGYNDLANLYKKEGNLKEHDKYYALALKNVENAKDIWQEF